MAALAERPPQDCVEDSPALGRHSKPWSANISTGRTERQLSWTPYLTSKIVEHIVLHGVH